MPKTTSRLNALTVYLILQFSTALLYSLVFAVETVYHIMVAKLNPLQLILVGTILESTVFLFEIPTGTVDDVRTRRLSVIS
jgi:DHA3 family tetracycline resistance protein-like MFS transporter